MNFEDDEIVHYPVHKRFLPVVVQAHAAAMEAEITVPVVEMANQQEKLLPIDWTQVETMKTLRRGLTSQVLRPGLKVQIGIALMDAVAEATLSDPPRRVLFDEVYKRAGFTDDAPARSSLGAFTKVIRREFKVSFEDAKWPIEFNWGNRGEANYSMSPDVARAWLASAS